MQFKLYSLIVIVSLFVGPLTIIAAPVLILDNVKVYDMQYKRDLDLANNAYGQKDSMVLQKRGTFTNLSNKIPGIHSNIGQKVVLKGSEAYHRSLPLQNKVAGHVNTATTAIRTHAGNAANYAKKQGAAIASHPATQAVKTHVGNAASYAKKQGSAAVSSVRAKASSMRTSSVRRM